MFDVVGEPRCEELSEVVALMSASLEPGWGRRRRRVMGSVAQDGQSAGCWSRSDIDSLLEDPGRS
jgi:hypothetical protein